MALSNLVFFKELSNLQPPITLAFR
jgi:hypothetical protein